MDFILRERVIASTLAGIDDFSAWRCQPEEQGVDERVVHDDVRAAQDFGASESKETGIARTCPDEVNAARFRFRHGRSVEGRPGAGEGRRENGIGLRNGRLSGWAMAPLRLALGALSLSVVGQGVYRPPSRVRNSGRADGGPRWRMQTVAGRPKRGDPAEPGLR